MSEVIGGCQLFLFLSRIESFVSQNCPWCNLDCKILAVHSVPLEVLADNMQFASSQMKVAVGQWGFDITTSSP